MIENNNSLLAHRSWLLIILLIALLLRIVNLGEYSFWFDEKITLSNAQGIARSSVLEKPVFTTQDVWQHSSTVQACIEDDSGNGILNTFVAKVWTSIVGYREGWVRLLSVLWGVLGVFLTFVLARRFFGEAVALLAAIIMAIHPLAIEYSQEFRAYPQTLVLTLLSTLVLVRQMQAAAVANFDKYYLYWGLYALLIPAVFLSHYLAFSLFFVHGLIILAARNKQLFLYFLGASVVGGLLCGIWMLYGGFEGLKYMASRNERYLRLIKNGVGIDTNLKNAVGGVFEIYLPLSGNFLKYAGFRIRELFILAILFTGLLIPIYHFFKGDKEHKFWGLSLVLLSFFGIGLSIALAIQSGHTIAFTARYSFWCLPYLSILLAWAIHRVFIDKRSIYRSIYAVLIGVWVLQLLLSDYLVWIDASKQRQSNGFFAIKADILKTISPTDTLVYNYPGDALIFNMYLPQNNPILQKIKLRISDDSISCMSIYSKEGFLLKRYDTNFENLWE